MNGTSGFGEGRSSTPRSQADCSLHEQEHQCGTACRHPFLTYDFIALSAGISTKREMGPDTFSVFKTVPQVRLKHRVLFSTPIRTTSCPNIKSVRANESVHFLTSQETIR
jgi:hypothetical protein